MHFFNFLKHFFRFSYFKVHFFAFVLGLGFRISKCIFCVFLKKCILPKEFYDLVAKLRIRYATFGGKMYRKSKIFQKSRKNNNLLAVGDFQGGFQGEFQE